MPVFNIKLEELNQVMGEDICIRIYGLLLTIAGLRYEESMLMKMCNNLF